MHRQAIRAIRHLNWTTGMYPHRAPALQSRRCQSWKPGGCNLVHTRSARHPATATPWEQLPVPSSSHAAQEEEEFFFGPDWLKSLGATTMEPLTPQEPELPPIPTHSEEPEPSVSSTPTATFEQAAAWATPPAET